MPYPPVADTQITLINGISATVYIHKSENKYAVWFELTTEREEYEFYGRGDDWDKAEAFCRGTIENPWISGKLQTLNKRINEVNKYPNSAGFYETCGLLRPLHTWIGA